MRRLILIYWLPVVAYAGFIFWLSSITIPELPVKPFISVDKIAHFIEYGVFGWLISRACLNSSPRTGGRTSGFTQRHTLMLSIIIAVSYAFSDEWHQFYVPNRQMSQWDFLADVLGALTAIVISVKRSGKLATEIQRPRLASRERE